MDINPYINLEKGARCEGDPISAYLFILALEVLFELTLKSNADIKGITTFNHAFFVH